MPTEGFGVVETSGDAVLRDLATRGPALVVVAHPDDESFGLGAVLAAFTRAGSEVRVLCFTRGEASTLGAGGDLAEIRRAELGTAAAKLGIAGVVLLGHPDGALADVDPAVLDAAVLDALGSAATLVVFEAGGVTGHPDHRAATASAIRVAAARGLDVVEWGVAPAVAATLNAELGAAFSGLDGEGVVDLPVDRAVQLAAIACHESQATDNPVLLRRLELSGSVDRVRVRRAGD